MVFRNKDSIFVRREFLGCSGGMRDVVLFIYLFIYNFPNKTKILVRIELYMN